MTAEPCFSCHGTGTVCDLGNGEMRPCMVCQKADYGRWVAERRPATRRVAELDAIGRCCGRKPIPYRRPPHLFCPRCNAYLNPGTGRQIENWAWIADGDAFVATDPTHEYARRAKP